MSDDFRRMLDQTIEQKKAQDRIAEAKTELLRKQQEDIKAAEAQERAAALQLWQAFVGAFDEVVQAVNERSSETSIRCDQASWEEAGVLARAVHFHANSAKLPSLVLFLTCENKIAVQSALGTKSFRSRDFGPDNFRHLANNHFAAILNAR